MTNIKQSLATSKVPRIAKLFASSEYKLRNKAYKIVLKLLKSKGLGEGQGNVSKNELIAICKGLHYWLWMQDKALLHEEVVEKICKLVSEITSNDVRQSFISTMFETEHREWDTLDKHRIDKFMMLVRDFFASVLNILKASDFKDTAWFVSILSKYLINTDLNKSTGLKLHFVYLLLEELGKVKAPQVFIESILYQYCLVIGEMNKSHTLSKEIKKHIFLQLIKLHDKGQPLVDMKRVGQMLFELGAKKSTKATSRKVFYNFSKEFKKRASSSDDGAEKLISQPEPMDIEVTSESPKQNGLKCKTTPPSNNSKSINSNTSPKSLNSKKVSKGSTKKSIFLHSGDSDIMTLVDRITKADAKVTPKAPAIEVSATESIKSIERKRVSFGKIFRKPFTKRDMVATPSPSTLKVSKAPDKGILKPKRLSFSAPKSKKTRIRSSL